MEFNNNRLNEYRYNSHKNSYLIDQSKQSDSYSISTKSSLNDLYQLDASLKNRPLLSADPLDNFFQAKKVNLARSMKDIVGLIDNREMIKKRNLYGIALGECELMTKLHNMEHWYIGRDPIMDKRRMLFEKELLDFDKQKRMEKITAWKDTLLLKKDLRVIVTELYKEQSKQKMIDGGI